MNYNMFVWLCVYLYTLVQRAAQLRAVVHIIVSALVKWRYLQKHSRQLRHAIAERHRQQEQHAADMKVHQ
jgi:hypothetical protein